MRFKLEIKVNLTKSWKHEDSWTKIAIDASMKSCVSLPTYNVRPIKRKGNAKE